MHAVRWQVPASRPCHLWAETSPAAHPRPVGTHRDAPFILVLRSLSTEGLGVGGGGEGRQRHGLEYRALTPETAPFSNKMHLPPPQIGVF